MNDPLESIILPQQRRLPSASDDAFIPRLARTVSAIHDTYRSGSQSCDWRRDIPALKPETDSGGILVYWLRRGGKAKDGSSLADILR